MCVAACVREAACAAVRCALWGAAYHSIHRRLNYEPKLCDFLCMFVNTLEANDKNGPIRGNYMCLNIFLCRVDLSGRLFRVFCSCYFISLFLGLSCPAAIVSVNSFHLIIFPRSFFASSRLCTPLHHLVAVPAACLPPAGAAVLAGGRPAAP